MRVRKIIVSGFKSLMDEVSIGDLDRVNVFVGKNGAGKTNVIEVFRFLRELSAGRTHRPVDDFFSREKKRLALTLELTLDEGERKDILESLFEHNQSLSHADVINTNFLRFVTHQMEFSREKGLFDEAIRISNVLDGVLLIFHLSLETQSNRLIPKVMNMAESCSNLRRTENLAEALDGRGVALGAMDNWRVLLSIRDSDLLLARLRSFYANIEWVPPVRQSQHIMAMGEARRLDDVGSNIPQVWNTIASADPTELGRIGQDMKRIVGIDSVQAPFRANQAWAGLKDPTDWVFDLSNTSSGTHQVAILVTKIRTAPEGSVILVEEPELHLHAGAQRSLREIIEQHSSHHQFFITTHSTVFASTNIDCRLYVVTKKNGQSIVRRLDDLKEARMVKRELGHSNIDLYGFNLVVFIEGDSEEVAIPIVAEALGHDLERAGILLQNVKGRDKAKKIGQYLDYLKHIDVVPFVVADGNKELRKVIQDWEGGVERLPKGNHRIWDLEFEDLFPVPLISECCSELGYEGVTAEELEQLRGDSSIVDALRRILWEGNRRQLNKPDLAEAIAIKVAQTGEIPLQLRELIEELLAKADALANPTS
jgi:predicted ATPase